MLYELIQVVNELVVCTVFAQGGEDESLPQVGEQGPVGVSLPRQALDSAVFGLGVERLCQGAVDLTQAGVGGCCSGRLDSHEGCSSLRMSR